MGPVSGIVVFIMIWWTVIFCVLPWGVRHDENRPEGTPASAPSNPRIGFKFLVTTGISAVIWLIVYIIVESDLISFRR
jgi:predicted secreted protein